MYLLSNCITHDSTISSGGGGGGGGDLSVGSYIRCQFTESLDEGTTDTSAPVFPGQATLGICQHVHAITSDRLMIAMHRCGGALDNPQY